MLTSRPLTCTNSDPQSIGHDHLTKSKGVQPTLSKVIVDEIDTRQGL
jgi:hypothetical protein